MLDNPEVEPNAEQAEPVVSPADIFYGEPEPSVEPTEEPQEAETEEGAEESEEAAEEGQADDDTEDSDEVEVYDEKSDFVKYEKTEDGLYEFKSNKKTVQVNLETLISNFQGVQKQNEEIQKIAEERKGVFEQAKQQEIDSIKAEAARYQEAALQLESLVKEDSSVDWEDLKLSDPDEYIAKQELKQKREEALKGIREKAQAQQQAQLVEFRKVENQKLLDAMGWKDDDAMKADIQRWEGYLKQNGFTEQELQSIADHRFYKLVDQASRNESYKTAEVTEIKNKPRVVRKVKREKQPQKKQAPKTTAEMFYGSN